MNHKRYTFVRTIQFLLSASLVVFTVVIIISHVIQSQHQFKQDVIQSRAAYIETTRSLIKHEVEHVARTIDCKSVLIQNRTGKQVKQRVTEAHAIAEYIYRQNVQTKSESEIKQMIIDALRPIRFAEGSGYYFITGFDGTEILFADKPELEGTNMLSVRGGQGKYVVKDLLEIAKTRGEGHFTYFWSKPDNIGKDHKKISYTKAFEPFRWAIGTGLYVEDVDKTLQQEVVSFVNDYRFGKDSKGYVFVLDLIDIRGGDDFAIMYANPNRPDILGQYISDSFQDAKGKQFRKEVLAGLRKDGECYVDYWYQKLDNPEPRPKTSYFKLTNDGRFIVAAGVYLDETEAGVLEIQNNINQQMHSEVRNTIIAGLIIIVVFLTLFHVFSRKLLRDFSQLFTIFKHAAQDEKTIDRNKIKYKELYEIAGDANTMLRDKITAQQNVLEEKNLLAVTLRSIADAVIAVDGTGHITLMNHIAEELCGWKEEEASGKSVVEVFDVYLEGDMGQKEDPVGQALQSGQIVTSETFFLLRPKGGSQYKVESSAAPIRDSSGSIRGAILVFRDITDQLQKEQMLFRSRKLESVGLLAGGIAHDFNNLLTSLFGNIQMARIELSPDHESYGFLEIAEQSMENATNLTNQLLTFARGGDPIKTTLSIAETIVESARFSLRGNNIKLILEIDPNLSLVEADKGQLNQVVSNLVINAQQAMPAGGSITLAARNQGDMVVISVSDEGVGISPQHISNIFDPYFTTKSQGSGLGLASSHSIITKHNGTINVESKPGEGATFTIYLPASTQTKISQPNNDSNQTHVENSFSACILVLDDEKGVRDVVGKMLALLGHSVSFAATGEEALDLYIAYQANGTPFDIVITDLTIPGGMGGQETARKILKINPAAKIIVASGYATDPVLGSFKDYGFLGRLVKPYKIGDIRNVVARVFLD